MPNLLRLVIMPPSSGLTESQAIDSFSVSLPSRQCTKLAPLFVLPNQTVLGRFLSPFLRWNLSLWMVPDWQPWKLLFSVHRNPTCSQSLQCEISLRDSHWLRSTFQSGPRTASVCKSLFPWWIWQLKCNKYKFHLFLWYDKSIPGTMLEVPVYSQRAGDGFSVMCKILSI